MSSISPGALGSLQGDVASPGIYCSPGRTNDSRELRYFYMWPLVSQTNVMLSMNPWRNLISTGNGAVPHHSKILYCLTNHRNPLIKSAKPPKKLSLWSQWCWPCFNTVSQQQAANDSAVEEELGLIGATAEDTEAELIRKICETELLAGKKINKTLFFFIGRIDNPCTAFNFKTIPPDLTLRGLWRLVKPAVLSLVQRRTCCSASFPCWWRCAAPLAATLTPSSPPPPASPSPSSWWSGTTSCLVRIPK